MPPPENYRDATGLSTQAAATGRLNCGNRLKNLPGNRHWRSAGERITLGGSFADSPESLERKRRDESPGVRRGILVKRIAAIHRAADRSSNGKTPMSKPIDNKTPLSVTQAAVTVALAAYFLGLVLSIVANTGSGSSALVRTIKNHLFAPWMVPPWLDLGFDYGLTYGSEEDGDFRIEVRRQGDAKTPPVRLPGGLTGERAARWRRLAQSMAANADDADRDGVLAAAVGRGMFDELGSQDLVVRVLRTPLADRGGPPPAAVQAYSARIRMVDGEVQLLRAEARGEVAPLVRPAAGGNAADSRPSPSAEDTQ